MLVKEFSIDDLISYKKGFTYNKINNYIEEIYQLLPNSAKKKIKIEDIRIDFFTEDLNLPDNTIPYKLVIKKEYSTKLLKFLSSQILFLVWKR